MAKYIITNEKLQEYFDREFDNVAAFCEYLLQNGDPNVRQSLREIIKKEILKDDSENRRKVGNITFKEKQVEWIRENCCIEGEKIEETREQETELKSDENIDTGNNGENEFLNEDIIFETDFEKIKNEFENEGYKNLIQLEDEELDYTSDIVLREQGTITLNSKVQIIVNKEGLLLDVSKILIIAETGNKVLALGHLVQEKETVYTVVFEDKKCISYADFEGVGQARFVVYDKEGNAYSRLMEIEYKPFEIEKERPLCIDFGTSNTTVGSYGILNREKDEPEIVKFIDVTVTPNNTEATLLPTIVYVDDCSDPDNIKYLFGFEARKKIEEEHYESKASVYYEIKRWLSSAKNEKEEIRDSKNHKANPKKREIVKAYIDYVIEQSEQYFGTRFDKIHFSAPVKLKEQFISIFSELYDGEKTILSPEESIDEGIAIVYNKIITMSYAKESIGADKKSVMIMDCGGGTTDLASCEFYYEDTNAGRELNIKTCFENGNSNFGGNNITYRIMQLLKIKVAATLYDGVIENGGDAIELIDKSENEILSLIENDMESREYDSDKANNEVYSKFLENYRKAEEIIPTIYNGNEKYRGTEQIKKIKRNFYYLWRQAEQIKIDFYRSERVFMDFKDISDMKIDIRNHDNYYLYVADKNKVGLNKIDEPFKNVSITIKEINRVICGDIYALLVGVFGDGEVDKFDYYKLSGQSCKISLFSELIKEYIPGRYLRPAIVKQNNSRKSNSEDLKLDCVVGSINYIKDQLRPEMKIITKSEQPEIIYNVKLKGTHNNDEILFDCNDIDNIKFKICSENTKEYPLVVMGKDEVEEKSFIFKLREPEKDDIYWDTEKITVYLEKRSIASQKAIEDFIGKIKEEARNQKDNVNIVFLIPAKYGYGFYTGQILVENSDDGAKYKFPKFAYENFEDASKTFFDGRR